MNTKEMMKVLKDLGLKKQFKPYWDKEASTIQLRVNRPARIINGLLKGTEIILYKTRGLFNIWTQKYNKARKYAIAHGLKVDLYNKEAVLWVPVKLADRLLPIFGAKVQQTMSLAQKTHLAKLHRFRFLRKNPH